MTANPSEHRAGLIKAIVLALAAQTDVAPRFTPHDGERLWISGGCTPQSAGTTLDIGTIADAILAYLAAQQEREDDAYAFVKTVGRLKHSDDEDAPPISFADDHDTLNGLIAAARDIIATRKSIPAHSGEGKLRAAAPLPSSQGGGK